MPIVDFYVPHTEIDISEHSFLFKAKTIKGSKNDEMKLGPSFEPKQVYEILSVLKTTLSETVSKIVFKNS